MPNSPHIGSWGDYNVGSSSTAYQSYWTGIVEINGTAGKFTLVPAVHDNHHPNFKPGEYHLSEEWKQRQQQVDIEFHMYWNVRFVYYT